MGEDKRIEISEPMITADTLLKRWPGIYEHELAQIINESGININIPTAYFVFKALKRKDGNVVYYCRYADKNSYRYDFDLGYSFENIAFKLADIERHEQLHPEVLDKIIPIEDACVGNNGVDDIMTISEARNELGMSRARFVDLLNYDYDGCRLITSYEQRVRNWIQRNGYSGSKNINFFEIEMLANDDLHIEVLDWKDFKSSHPELFTSKNDNNQTSSNEDKKTLEADLAQCRETISDLKKSAAKKNSIIVAWAKKYSDVQANHEATIANKDKIIADLQDQVSRLQASVAAKPVEVTTVNADKWGNSVDAGMSLLVEIMTGNKTGWIKDAFTTALAGKYFDYHTKVLETAWKVLPDKYKAGAGRQKNTENPNQL